MKRGAHHLGQPQPHQVERVEETGFVRGRLSPERAREGTLAGLLTRSVDKATEPGEKTASFVKVWTRRWLVLQNFRGGTNRTDYGVAKLERFGAALVVGVVQLCRGGVCRGDKASLDFKLFRPVQFTSKVVCLEVSVRGHSAQSLRHVDRAREAARFGKRLWPVFAAPVGQLSADAGPHFVGRHRTG